MIALVVLGAIVWDKTRATNDRSMPLLMYRIRNVRQLIKRWSSLFKTSIRYDDEDKRGMKRFLFEKLAKKDRW